MAALDTYDWFVGTLSRELSPELRRLVREQRDYLLTLRSEDERQRYVEQALAECRAMMNEHVRN